MAGGDAKDWTKNTSTEFAVDLYAAGLPVFNNAIATVDVGTMQRPYAGIAVVVEGIVNTWVAVQVVNNSKGISASWQQTGYSVPLVFPVPFDAGDDLQINYRSLAALGQPLAIMCYGLAAIPGNLPRLRADWLLPPIGRLSASAVVVSAASGTVIAAPGVGLALMLKSLNFSIISGQPVDVFATRGGVTQPIVSSGSVTGWAKEWPGGLLLDSNTGVTQNLSASGTLRTNVDYDIVVH